MSGSRCLQSCLVLAFHLLPQLLCDVKGTDTLTSSLAERETEARAPEARPEGSCAAVSSGAPGSQHPDTQRLLFLRAVRVGGYSPPGQSMFCDSGAGPVPSLSWPLPQCVSSPTAHVSSLSSPVAGEASYRNKRRDGRLHPFLLHFPVPENLQSP